MNHSLILAALIALSGCSSGAVSTNACPDRRASNIIFWWETPALEPGEAITLAPYYTERPGMMEPLPPSCVTGASVGPQGQASISRDGFGGLVVRIAEDAAPGQVWVEARYARSGSVRTLIDVYDAATAPLTGVWSQDAAACDAAGAEPIRELIFEGDGGFSVTWTPFEAYKDYWGRYAYNSKTGRLTLEPEGGNHIPTTVRSGAVSLDETGRLRVEDASLGTPRSGPACSAPFDRRRG